MHVVDGLWAVTQWKITGGQIFTSRLTAMLLMQTLVMIGLEEVQEGSGHLCASEQAGALHRQERRRMGRQLDSNEFFTTTQCIFLIPHMGNTVRKN